MESHVSFWNIQTTIYCVKMGRISSHEETQLLRVLLAISPQPLCSQDLSITLFSKKVNSVFRGRGL